MKVIYIFTVTFFLMSMPTYLQSEDGTSTLVFHMTPDSRLRIDDPKNPNHQLLWKDVIGRQVVAQGIAFNYSGKFPVPYIDLGSIHGSRIFIKGKVLSANEAEGRIVSARGRLLVEDVPAILSNVPIQQAPSGKRYFIDVEEMRVLSTHNGHTIELR